MDELRRWAALTRSEIVIGLDELVIRDDHLIGHGQSERTVSADRGIPEKYLLSSPSSSLAELSSAISGLDDGGGGCQVSWLC